MYLCCFINSPALPIFRRRRYLTPLELPPDSMGVPEAIRSLNSSCSDLDVFNSLIKIKERYFDLDQVTDAELLFSFLHNLRKELSPVATFVGSCVSQDVVNALSGRKPMVDVKLFDASISKIHPLLLTPPEQRQMTIELMRSLYPK